MADKRLFEQTAITYVELNAGTYDLHKVAIGKAGNITVNTTLTQLVQWLKTALATTTGFLKRSSNLSDLLNASTARANLNVYSIGDTYSQTEVNNINTNTNNRFGSGNVWNWSLILFDGLVTINNGTKTITCTKTGTGLYTVTHNAGTNVYVPICICYSSIGNFIEISDKGPNDFDIQIYNTTGSLTDSAFILFLYGA